MLTMPHYNAGSGLYAKLKKACFTAELESLIGFNPYLCALTALLNRLEKIAGNKTIDILNQMKVKKDRLGCFYILIEFKLPVGKF